MLAAFVVVSMVTSDVSVSPRDCTDLQAAVVTRDTEGVHRLAGKRLLGFVAPAVDVNERAIRGECGRKTALMLAAETGQLDVAQILISSGAQPYVTSSLPGFNDGLVDARCLALANNMTAMVALLDKHGATPTSCTEAAELYRLLLTDDVESLQHQLSIGPTPLTLEAMLSTLIGTRLNRATDLMIQRAMLQKLDFTRLYEAAILARDLAFVQKLSDGGARVKGDHTLALAIAGGQSAMVGPLVTAGARPADARGAILDAVRRQDRAVIRALLDHNYRGDDITPLLVLAIDHAPDLVPELVRAGVEVEIDDEAGRTPLMAAAKTGKLELVNLLLERGASTRTGDLDCVTAAGYGIRERSLDLAVALQTGESTVPGRAARRQGITCGRGAVTFRVEPTDEVRLKPYSNGAVASTSFPPMLPLRAGKTVFLNPGLHLVELRETTTGRQFRATLKVEPGMNSFSRAEFGLYSPPVVPGREHEALERKRVPLKRCVADQNRREPRQHGEVLFTLLVTHGKVTQVKAEHDRMPTTLYNCVSSLAMSWTFDPEVMPSTPVPMAVKF